MAAPRENVNMPSRTVTTEAGRPPARLPALLARYAAGDEGVVWLGGGYPELCDDITRNLEKAARRLADNPGSAVVTFTRDPDAVAAQHDEITATYRDRNEATRRDVDLARWERTWATATELATLRVGGQLAAWLLASPDPPIYRVLAGQMAHPLRRLIPGRALESVAVARALAGPTPWPAFPDVIETILKTVSVRQADGTCQPCAWLDWGQGHPETLLTARRRIPARPHCRPS
jgi:hypothetical protein